MGREKGLWVRIGRRGAAACTYAACGPAGDPRVPCMPNGQVTAPVAGAPELAGVLDHACYRSLINREGTPITRCAAKGPPVARRHPRAPGGPRARVYCLANGSDIDAAFSRCAGGMRWPRRRRKRPAAASESRCFRLSAFVIKAISHTRHLLPPPPASYAPFSAGGPPTGHGPAPS